MQIYFQFNVFLNLTFLKVVRAFLNQKLIDFSTATNALKKVRDTLFSKIGRPLIVIYIDYDINTLWTVRLASVEIDNSSIIFVFRQSSHTTICPVLYSRVVRFLLDLITFK